MATSPEYPDLAWMQPKSWTPAGRSSVQVVVIHTTEGSEGRQSAEDGAAYDAQRTDGTSTHYFHDQDTTVQCVQTKDIAHAARAHGNIIGIQHELCGKAGQGTAGWSDAASLGTLENGARQVARDCLKWSIPARRLSASQVRSGVKGICGHVDITNAFPEDNGDHQDPRPTFPWGTFIARVQQLIEENDMPSVDEIADEMMKRLNGTKNNVPIGEKGLIQGEMDKYYKDLTGPSGIKDAMGKIVDERITAAIPAIADAVAAKLAAK